MRENAYLSDSEIELIESKLLNELERLKNSDDHGLGEMNKDDLSDPIDEANSNIQASHELRMKNREVFYLKKLNQGLLRIKEGSFGLCKECGDDTGFERLMARPTAELCINCKEESEMEERNNFFGKKSKSLGKTPQEIFNR